VPRHGLSIGMGLEVGVILPTSTPDPARPILADVRESARFAEEVGLDSVWSTDHLIASGPMLDSSVVLATAAALTERITVGFNVMLLALRPVAWAAKQVNTLQLLSNNRIVLGVGTGNPAHGDIGWRAAGVEFAERGRLTDEALEVLRDLIARTRGAGAADICRRQRCTRAPASGEVRRRLGDDRDVAGGGPDEPRPDQRTRRGAQPTGAQGNSRRTPARRRPGRAARRVRSGRRGARDSPTDRRLAP
jgi:alkanesulfonate monooxygenase SsuD/methylene tetrahydromethanopterin reductase-like flavin-dependent oxidoreductase (luciferase family)